MSVRSGPGPMTPVSPGVVFRPAPISRLHTLVPALAPLTVTRSIHWLILSGCDAQEARHVRS